MSDARQPQNSLTNPWCRTPATQSDPKNDDLENMNLIFAEDSNDGQQSPPAL